MVWNLFGLRQATCKQLVMAADTKPNPGAHHFETFYIIILMHANTLAFLRLDVFLHVSLCFPHPDVTEAEQRDVSFFDPNKDGSQK